MFCTNMLVKCQKEATVYLSGGRPSKCFNQLQILLAGVNARQHRVGQSRPDIRECAIHHQMGGDIRKRGALCKYNADKTYLFFLQTFSFAEILANHLRTQKYLFHSKVSKCVLL